MSQPSTDTAHLDASSGSTGQDDKSSARVPEGSSGHFGIDRFHNGYSNVGYTLTIVAVVVYALLALSGPHGIRALRAKHDEIRGLEQQIAILRSENQIRKEKIDRLQDSREEQDLEIRKQRKMVLPGERTFIIQDEPQPPSSQSGQ